MRCSTLTPPQDVAVKIINLEGISSDMEDIRKEVGRRDAAAAGPAWTPLTGPGEALLPPSHAIPRAYAPIALAGGNAPAL